MCTVPAEDVWLSVKVRRKDPPHHAGDSTMSYRNTLAAVMLAAIAVPAAAQVTSQPTDTTKKRATVTTSPGSIADTAATTPTPSSTTSPAPSTNPGASV